MSTKYGITAQKKQELNRLKQQVLTAKATVLQQQAVVDALNEKLAKIQADLGTSEANKATALSNKNLVDEVIENLLILKNNSEITYDETVQAESKIKKTFVAINQLIQQLIFSAEVINKLENLILRKKAKNPLISHELVSTISNAANDASNAVALTLTAFDSIVSTQTNIKAAEAAISLELLQVTELYEFVIGENTDAIKNEKSLSKRTSITGLLEKAYEIQTQVYNQTLIASKDTLEQLNKAKRELSTSITKLNSLETGLAAANAAALAS